MRLVVALECAIAVMLWLRQPIKLFPTPREVLHAWPELWFGGLGVELWTSATLNAEALALASIFSLSLAYLTVVPVFRPVATFVGKLRFLGLVGITFVFTILASSGHALKLSLLTFGMSVFFVTSMVDTIANIPQDHYDHARTLRMSEWRVVLEVVILGTLAHAFDVLRQNAAIGWMLVPSVEVLSRTEGGIGIMMTNQSKYMNLAHVGAAICSILVVGMLIDYTLVMLKRLVCPYAALGLERR